MRIYSWCLLGMLVTGTVQVVAAAETLSLTTNWNFAGSHTSIVSPFVNIQGRSYVVPKFPSILGELVEEEVELTGTGIVTVNVIAPHTGGQRANAPLTFPGLGFFILDWWTFIGQPQTFSSKEWTLTGRNGAPLVGNWATNFGEEHLFRVDALISTSVTPTEDGNANTPTTTVNVSGTVTTDYLYEPSELSIVPVRPLILRELSGPDAQDGFLRAVPVPEGVDEVGVIGEIEGQARATRANGQVDQLVIGSPIFFGDVIETGEGGSINIEFVDETEFAVSEEAKLAIDEYVFDPSDESGDRNFSILKGIFKFTEGLIGRDDPDGVVVEKPFGSIGFRGDAEAIVRDDLINNPQPGLGTVGIWTETASPVGFSTFVDLAEKPLNLTFSIAFLNDVGDFSLKLGDVELLALSGSEEQIGQPERYEIALDIGSGAHLLSFNLDGAASNSMVVWDMEIDRIPLTDFSAIGREGSGAVDTVYIASEEQLSKLQSQLLQPMLTLRNERWEQIALPAVVGGRTPQDLFGDDLSLADYTRTWILYGYNPTSNMYVEASLTEPLERGRAYWIIQATGENVEIDFEIDDNIVALETQADCPVLIGCYAVPLQHTTDTRAVTWNMVGHPFVAGLSVENTRIAYMDDETGVHVSIPLNEAEFSGLVNNEIFVYNSLKGVYDVYTDTTQMNIWDAGWMALLPASRGLESLSWLVPHPTSEN